MCSRDRRPRTAEEGKSRRGRTTETGSRGPRACVLKNGPVPAKVVGKGRKSHHPPPPRPADGIKRVKAGKHKTGSHNAMDLQGRRDGTSKTKIHEGRNPWQ